MAAEIVSPAGSIFAPELLSRCISCGFCLAACPTYALTGDETSSPRGRITLMRALESGALPPGDPTLAEQSSFCLGCRACEPVCPAGVQYGELLEQWREQQWAGRRRPPVVALLIFAAERAFAHRVAGLLRGAARSPASASGPSLMLGCFERSLFPAVSRAARALAPELAAPDRQGCCGALHAHNGEPERGRQLARQLGTDLPGRIVTTSGGCAAHLSDVVGRSRVTELSEYLRGRVTGQVQIGGRLARVGLQDSCHLRNGLGVWREPRELLSAVADYVELPGAGGCCGAAGTYSLVRPRDSRRVLDPKLDAIEAAGIDYVIAVNPGCLRQLQQGLRRRRSPVRALHIAELLRMAALAPAADDGGGEGR
ncbi:MAG: (Fe-S)-binding protein [Streptosporangiaceae bacterium]|jgi:glycolate oxidase iron-sulfur subunit